MSIIPVEVCMPPLTCEPMRIMFGMSSTMFRAPSKMSTSGGHMIWLVVPKPHESHMAGQVPLTLGRRTRARM